jgi:hypothetical protein
MSSYPPLLKTSDDSSHSPSHSQSTFLTSPKFLLIVIVILFVALIGMIIVFSLQTTSNDDNLCICYDDRSEVYPSQYLNCGGNRYSGLPFSTRSPVFARHAVASTSVPLVTSVALEIMRKGGNAIDAAIAANAVQGLMEPTGSGIGGDLMGIAFLIFIFQFL